MYLARLGLGRIHHCLELLIHQDRLVGLRARRFGGQELVQTHTLYFLCLI
jgi:hypothetical protein